MFVNHIILINLSLKFMNGFLEMKLWMKKKKSWKESFQNRNKSWIELFPYKKKSWIELFLLIEDDIKKDKKWKLNRIDRNLFQKLS